MIIGRQRPYLDADGTCIAESIGLVPPELPGPIQ